MTSLSLPYGQLKKKLGISRARQRHDAVAVKPTRWQIAIWAALLVVCMLLFVSDYARSQVGVYPDEADYIVLARSLVSAGHYGLINFPGAPHLSNYPFGLPLFLAPFEWLWPDNLNVIKLVPLCATLLNVTLLFWGWPWLTRRYSRWWGLAVAALYALSPVTTNHMWLIMSEPLFLTFCLLAMILTEQAARGQQGRWWWLWMGAVLLFVVFIRTAGVALLGSVMLYLLVADGRAIWRTLALSLGGLVALAVLIVVATSVQVQDLLPIKYVNEAATTTVTESHSAPIQIDNQWAARLSFFITQNLAVDVNLTIIPLAGGQTERQFLDSEGAQVALRIFGLAFCGLLFVGYLRWFRQEGLTIFQFFLIPYWALLFVWVWKGPRLLYPVLPQLLFCLLLSVEAIVSGAARLIHRTESFPTLRRWVLPSVVIGLMLISAYKSARFDDTRLHIGDIQARSMWLKSNAPAAAIVMSEHPETDYLYSGRQTVFYPEDTSNLQSHELIGYLRDQNVQYILIAPHNWWQDTYRPEYSPETNRLLTLIAEPSLQQRLTLVYSAEPSLVKIYQVNP